MSRDMNLVYLQSAVTPNRGNLQEYFLGNEPREVSGAHSLVQLVVMTLLNEPGSHTLDPGWGVGIQRTLRRPYGNLDDIRGSVVVDIARARDQILQRQSGEPMSDDERLQDLSVQNVYQDDDGVVIVLQITTAAGAVLVLNSKDFLV